MVSSTINFQSQLTFKTARTIAELEAAFRLVHDAYVRERLSNINPSGMRVTPYHLIPTTEVFVAKSRADVIATMSLIADSPLGLPMESIYAQEIGDCRKSGFNIAEISCLADRRADLRRSFPVVLQLMRLVGQCARHRGIDQLLVTCHPRHAKLYRRLMAFQQVGSEKAYPTVCNNHAVALLVDLQRLPEDHPAIYERFFGVPLPDVELERRSISPRLLDRLRDIMELDTMTPIACPVVQRESVEPVLAFS